MSVSDGYLHAMFVLRCTKMAFNCRLFAIKDILKYHVLDLTRLKCTSCACNLNCKKKIKTKKVRKSKNIAYITKSLKIKKKTSKLEKRKGNRNNEKILACNVCFKMYLNGLELSVVCD